MVALTKKPDNVSKELMERQRYTWLHKYLKSYYFSSLRNRPDWIKVLYSEILIPQEDIVVLFHNVWVQKSLRIPPISHVAGTLVQTKTQRCDHNDYLVRKES